MIRIETEIDKYIRDYKTLTDYEKQNEKVLPIENDKLNPNNTNKMDYEKSNQVLDDNIFENMLQEEISKISSKK